MPSDGIFLSCRKGDLARIKYLVEKNEVDLNVRDCWDSTPLYYACHCGHQQVVQYLLANGARCEANTFDGERCFYGALTNDIKLLLLDSKIFSGSKKRDDFDEFCERMMKAEEFSDMNFIVEGQKFKVHRCLMAGRSQYFRETLKTKKWKPDCIQTYMISAKVFDEFVKFVYTGRLTCNVYQCDDIIKLSNKTKVRNLTADLRNAKSESQYYEMSKKKVEISTLIVDTPSSRNDLIEDFESLINPGLPEEFVKNPFYGLKCFPTDCDGMDYRGSENEIFDLCLIVDGYRFYCNKLFVCTRSEYFRVLIEDPFTEFIQENEMPVVTLRNVKPSVLACILYYIYTNSPHLLTEDNVLDVLEAADIYLLVGLKKHCTSYFCTLLSVSNVMDLLHIARLHDLPKLEDACAAFIAANISITESEEFRKCVIQDAQQVEKREETDSIPIVDDVRYHISNAVATFSEVEEAHAKLKLIDDLLEKLGLEA